MNFFKRASTSILRTPGKTVVLLLLVFILGTVIAGAIAVEGAIHNTEAHLRNTMRPIVSFSPDRDALGQWGTPERNLTPEVVREIASLPYVAVHNYAIITSFSTRSLISYPVAINFTDGGVGMTGIGTGGGGIRFEVTGSSTTELFEVQEGLLELVGGRMFTEVEIVSASDVHPVIISRRLAEENNLSLQSTFEIVLTTFVPQTFGSNAPATIFQQEIMQFKVVGLFELVSDILDIPQDRNDLDMDAGAVFALLHTLFLPNASAEIIHRFQIESNWGATAYLMEREGLDIDDLGGGWDLRAFDPNPEYESYVRSIMQLYDPNDLEAFRIVAQPMLPDDWVIDDLLHTFDDVRASMEGLQSIANWVLWTALGATLLILSLIITLFLRDRRHEVGVYLALGEKKTKITAQILMEVVVVALVGMTVSVFAGSIISNAMTQEMIRNELVAEPAHRFDSGGGGWEGVSLEHMNVDRGITLDELIEAFDLSLSGGTIGLFYVIGLSAVILSTVLPIIYVVRLNPKKVLMGS